MKADLLGFFIRLQVFLGLRKIPYFVGGSLPRKVSLAESEVDVFIKIQPQDVEPLFLEAIKEFKDVNTCLNSKGIPYLTLTGTYWAIDLVPAYAGLLTENSVLHHGHFRNRSGRECIYVLEAKSILNALGLYGADSRIEGFSGFLCELLIEQVGPLPLATTAALSKFLYGVIMDPCASTRNLHAALCKSAKFRLLAWARGFKTPQVPVYTYEAATCPEKDFPRARRYFARMAQWIPLDVWSSNKYLYVRTPVVKQKLYFPRAYSSLHGAPHTEVWITQQGVVTYASEQFEVSNIPGLKLV